MCVITPSNGHNSNNGVCTVLIVIFRHHLRYSTINRLLIAARRQVYAHTGVLSHQIHKGYIHLFPVLYMTTNADRNILTNNELPGKISYSLSAILSTLSAFLGLFLFPKGSITQAQFLVLLESTRTNLWRCTDKPPCNAHKKHPC